jgi:uncharacterized membrane protein
MDILPAAGTVFVLGALELWAAIPAGFALGLAPAVTAIAAALGAITGVLVIVLVGDRARTWLLARHGPGSGGRGGGTISRVWERYGVIGLGLLAPLLVGAALGAALGLLLGATTRRLLLWLSAGIVLWSVILTGAAALGLAGLESIGG